MLNSAAVGVNNVAAGGDVLGQARDEVVEGDCAEIQSAQAAYGDGAILLLLVADDEDVRHLLQAVLPDFTSDFFTAQIRFNPKALFFRLCAI